MNTKEVKEVVFRNRSSLSSVDPVSNTNTPRGSVSVQSSQANLTEDEIKNKLKNYKRIRNIPELKDVKASTWVKYFNINLNQFRVGGVLTNNGYPDFFILKNPYNKKSWSVQLKDNVFFVPDTSKIEKEKAEKDELHRLYKGGMLKFSKYCKPE
jgi:hypothetical protein